MAQIIFIGENLNGYKQGDVVDVLESGVYPGVKVTPPRFYILEVDGPASEYEYLKEPLYYMGSTGLFDNYGGKRKFKLKNLLYKQAKAAGKKLKTHRKINNNDVVKK